MSDKLQFVESSIKGPIDQTSAVDAEAETDGPARESHDKLKHIGH